MVYSPLIKFILAANVGKYTSPMDPTGKSLQKKRDQQSWLLPHAPIPTGKSGKSNGFSSRSFASGFINTLSNNRADAFCQGLWMDQW